MRSFHLVPAALLLLSACATYSVKYDFDPGANFRAYRTFEWYASSKRARGQSSGSSPLMDRRVQAAVEQQLKAKGYAAATAEPDFLVTYYPVYRDRRYRTTTTVGVGGGFRYHRFGYGVGTRFSEVHHYTEGTIVVEIVDGKSNQLVWQGAAVGALTNLDNPEDAQEQVARAVADMLEKFPPR
jgi:hypothetical protein